MHADYLSSIAVIVSVIGAKLGFRMLDHIVAILEAFHVIYVSGQMLGSAINGLMDSAADPQLIDRLERVIGEVKSVTRVPRVIARWAGQRLLAQVDVGVAGDMSASEADRVRADIQQAVRMRVCGRSETFVRISPAAPCQPDKRSATARAGNASPAAAAQGWVCAVRGLQ
jgi:divalent metal cation (Fe/Co/Zn/Cd) transporter